MSEIGVIPAKDMGIEITLLNEDQRKMFSEALQQINSGELELDDLHRLEHRAMLPGEALEILYDGYIKAMESVEVTDRQSGLLSRRGMAKYLRPMLGSFVYSDIKRSVEQAGSRRLAVIVVDAHIKPINDKYGHEVGDQAIAKVAERIGQSARTGDVVGRYRGGQFAIIFPYMEDQTGQPAISDLANRYKMADLTLDIAVDGQTVVEPIGVDVKPITYSPEQAHGLIPESDGQARMNENDLEAIIERLLPADANQQAPAGSQDEALFNSYKLPQAEDEQLFSASKEAIRVGRFSLSLLRRLRDEKVISDQEIHDLTVDYTEYLEKRATVDTFTGLLNRNGFYKKLSQMLRRLLNEKRPEVFEGNRLALVMADINGMSELNSISRKAGDDAILCLSEDIDHSIRPGDIDARLGGDEFAAAMSYNIGQAGEDAIRNKISERFPAEKDIKIQIVQGDQKYSHDVYSAMAVCFFTVSEVMAITGGDFGPAGIKKLMDIADKSMYKAKQVCKLKARMESQAQTS